MNVRREWVYEPGNGTRYWIIAGAGNDDTPWIALPDFGTAAVMEWRRYVTVGYVQAKLDGLTDADCEAVTAFLNSELPIEKR